MRQSCAVRHMAESEVHDAMRRRTRIARTCPSKGSECLIMSCWSVQHWPLVAGVLRPIWSTCCSQAQVTAVTLCVKLSVSSYQACPSSFPSRRRLIALATFMHVALELDPEFSQPSLCLGTLSCRTMGCPPGGVETGLGADWPCSRVRETSWSHAGSLRSQRLLASQDVMACL